MAPGRVDSGHSCDEWYCNSVVGISHAGGNDLSVSLVSQVVQWKLSLRGKRQVEVSTPAASEVITYQHTGVPSHTHTHPQPTEGSHFFHLQVRHRRPTVHCCFTVVHHVGRP